MKFEKEDLENLLKLLSYEEHGLEKAHFNKEVDPALASACIKAWKSNFGTGVPSGINASAVRAAYTETITFASPDLVKWLVKVGDPSVTNTNNIKICLGIYTAEMVAQYALPTSKTGRLTVFLWPYCDDKQATFLNAINPGPVPPYNIGSLYP